MGIFANLLGILACLLQGIWDIWYPPIQASKIIKVNLFLPVSKTPFEWRFADGPKVVRRLILSASSENANISGQPGLTHVIVCIKPFDYKLVKNRKSACVTSRVLANLNSQRGVGVDYVPAHKSNTQFRFWTPAHDNLNP